MSISYKMFKSAFPIGETHNSARSTNRPGQADVDHGAPNNHVYNGIRGYFGTSSGGTVNPNIDTAGAPNSTSAQVGDTQDQSVDSYHQTPGSPMPPPGGTTDPSAQALAAENGSGPRPDVGRYSTPAKAESQPAVTAQSNSDAISASTDQPVESPKGNMSIPNVVGTANNIFDLVREGVQTQLDKPKDQLYQEYFNKNFTKGEAPEVKDLATPENIKRFLEFAALPENKQHVELMKDDSAYRKLFQDLGAYLGENSVVFDKDGAPSLAASTFEPVCKLIDAGEGSMYIELARDMNSGDPKKATAAKKQMDGLFNNYTKEQQDVIKSKLQSKIWSGVWANPIENLPVAVGMFLRNHELDGLAGFVENPWAFWLSTLAILFGGGMLLGNMLDGDDEPRQQMNPGWTTIPYQGGGF